MCKHCNHRFRIQWKIKKHIRRQGQARNKIKLEASATGFAALIPPLHCTGPEAPPEEILPKPKW